MFSASISLSLKKKIVPLLCCCFFEKKKFEKKFGRSVFFENNLYLYSHLQVFFGAKLLKEGMEMEGGKPSEVLFSRASLSFSLPLFHSLSSTLTFSFSLFLFLSLTIFLTCSLSLSLSLSSIFRIFILLVCREGRFLCISL